MPSSIEEFIDALERHYKAFANLQSSEALPDTKYNRFEKSCAEDEHRYARAMLTEALTALLVKP